MSRQGKIALACVLAVVMIAGGWGLLNAFRPGGKEWWTDGLAIREAAHEAPIREILWKPAERVPAPAGVNIDAGAEVSADEYEPRLNADGTVMVFVRRRPGTNADLFTRQAIPTSAGTGGWSDPAPIDALNTEYDELGPELSRDGESLYFYSDRPGGLGGYDLWVSRRAEGAWGTPVNLGPSVNSGANEYGPALAPDGSRLYFSSNRPRPGEAAPANDAWTATIRERRSRHDYDLYAADLSAGESSWASAIPLTRLNTPSDEGCPALSPVGDFLYFASDRSVPGSFGGYDVYRSRLSTQGSRDPGEPENLGAAVNSKANDLDPGLSTDGFRIYFSSDRAPSAESDESPSYRLWCSASREVYRERDARPPLALGDFLSELWPWLIVLLGSALLGYLLYRLLGSEMWRRRFAQLSLLAQCLLISLLIHALIGSGLAVWKVGAGLIAMAQRSSGTQVILSSSAGAGGDITSQVFGPAGDSGELTVPALASLAADLTSAASFDAPLHEQSPAQGTPIADAPAVSAAPGESAPAPSMPPLAAAPAPAPSSTHANLPAPSAPDAPRAEAASHIAEAPSASPAAPVNGAITSAPTAQVTPAPGEISGAGAPLVAADLSTGPSRLGAPIAAPSAPSSDTSTAAPVLPRVQPGATSGEEASLTLPAAGVPPLTPSAPLAGGSAVVAAPRAAIAPGPGSSSTSSANPGVMGAAAPIERSGATTPGGTGPAVPSAETSVAGGSSGIPRIAAPVGPAGAAPGSGESTVAPGVAIGALAAPVPSASRAGGGAARIDVPLAGSSTRGGNADRSTLGASEGDSSRSAPSTIGTPGASSLPGLDTGPGAGGIRLPAQPPEPVERFEQRAPEVREEVLTKMGGSAETEKAVSLALDWFSRHQEKDGRWTGRHFDDHCGECSGAAAFDADAAMTGMALLCYLGAGHTHMTDGPHKDTVDRALRWLVARQAPDGDLRRGETMYGQTVGAIALCEAYAMTKDKSLADPTRRAVEFVLRIAAKPRNQRTPDEDISVLGWLVMTMKSAERAGFPIPKDTYDAAAQWLDYVSTREAPGRYANRKGEAPTMAMTAEAMFVQQLLGRSRDETRMKQSADFLLRTRPRWVNGAPTFSWYYVTLALFEHQGEAWRTWNEAIMPELIRNQHASGPSAGSWDPQDEWSRMGGRIYQTAVCTLSLEVYYRYKPRDSR